MLFLQKRLLSLSLCLCLAFSLFGQVQPNSLGNVFIPENGFISVFGHHSFVDGSGLLKPGIIETYRSQNPGCVVYATNSSWSGASSMQYVDGFVKTYNSFPFTFPTGHKGYYGPVQLSNPFMSIVGFYKDSPLNLSDQKSMEIEHINSQQYWDIRIQEDSKVTLCWSHNLELGESLEQFRILGLNHDGVWEVIPSTVDPFLLKGDSFNSSYSSIQSTLNSASISSDEEILANKYQFFTIGKLSSLLETENSLQVTVFPNPQLVGSRVYVEFDEPVTQNVSLNIYKSDNSLLFTTIFEKGSRGLEVDYMFKESGAYILTVVGNNKITHENLVIVDP